MPANPERRSASVLSYERSREQSFFTDPGARAVWAAVSALEEGMKCELLDLLAAELAVPESRTSPSQIRVARADRGAARSYDLNTQRGREALRQEDYRSLRAEVRS